MLIFIISGSRKRNANKKEEASISNQVIEEKPVNVSEQTSTIETPKIDAPIGAVPISKNENNLISNTDNKEDKVDLNVEQSVVERGFNWLQKLQLPVKVVAGKQQ